MVLGVNGREGPKYSELLVSAQGGGITRPHFQESKMEGRVGGIITKAYPVHMRHACEPLNGPARG